MKEQSVIHSTFVIERSYQAPSERVFAAFADPVRKRRWFAEGHGREVEHHEMDFRAGGKERSRFRFLEGPVKGLVCTNDTVYQNIVPNRRVVFAYTMTLGEACISASLVTVELLPADTGTDVIFTHQGAFFEGADGPEMRQHGWGEILDRLTAEMSRAGAGPQP